MIEPNFKRWSDEKSNYNPHAVRSLMDGYGNAERCWYCGSLWERGHTCPGSLKALAELKLKETLLKKEHGDNWDERVSVNWRNTLSSHTKWWNIIDNLVAAARELGYPQVEWNGRLYTLTEKGYKHEGVITNENPYF